MALSRRRHLVRISLSSQLTRKGKKTKTTQNRKRPSSTKGAPLFSGQERVLLVGRLHWEGEGGVKCVAELAYGIQTLKIGQRSESSSASHLDAVSPRSVSENNQRSSPPSRFPPPPPLSTSHYPRLPFTSLHPRSRDTLLPLQPLAQAAFSASSSSANRLLPLRSTPLLSSPLPLLPYIARLSTTSQLQPSQASDKYSTSQSTPTRPLAFLLR